MYKTFLFKKINCPKILNNLCKNVKKLDRVGVADRGGEEWLLYMYVFTYLDYTMFYLRFFYWFFLCICPLFGCLVVICVACFFVL